MSDATVNAKKLAMILEYENSPEKKHREGLPTIRTNLLIGVLAEEATCAAFALAGIAELRAEKLNMYMYKEGETLRELEDGFDQLTKRTDIGVILVASTPFLKLQPAIRNLTKNIPAIIEIPDIYNDFDPYVSTSLALNTPLTQIIGNDQLQELKKAASSVHKIHY